MCWGGDRTWPENKAMSACASSCGVALRSYAAKNASTSRSGIFTGRVLGVGHFSRALQGHSCQAPKFNEQIMTVCHPPFQKASASSGDIACSRPSSQQISPRIAPSCDLAAAFTRTRCATGRPCRRMTTSSPSSILTNYGCCRYSCCSYSGIRQNGAR